MVNKKSHLSSNRWAFSYYGEHFNQAPTTRITPVSASTINVTTFLQAAWIYTKLLGIAHFNTFQVLSKMGPTSVYIRCQLLFTNIVMKYIAVWYKLCTSVKMWSYNTLLSVV